MLRADVGTVLAWLESRDRDIEDARAEWAEAATMISWKQRGSWAWTVLRARAHTLDAAIVRQVQSRTWLVTKGMARCLLRREQDLPHLLPPARP